MIRIVVMLAVFTALVFEGRASEIFDVEYAKVGDRGLKLDLYIPDGVKNPPLVMYMHGGGWKKGSKSRPHMRFIKEHGFALASIEYRFTDTAIFPAQIHDCKAALRFLKANASKYGYSVEKVAVSGSSAGGQLAALMGTSHGVEETEGVVGDHLDQSTSVQAVIDFFGCSDFILRSKTQYKRANSKTGIIGRLFNGGVEERKELATLASAVYHLDPNDPPFLIFHGTEDTSVLPDQSERMHSACQEVGVKSEVVWMEGVGHGGKAFYTDENKEKIVAFLNETLR